MGVLIAILLIVAIVIAIASIKVVDQYQRGVVLTLGKFSGIREPGLRFVVPVIQRIIMVDIRSTPIDVSKQEIITKDNVTAGVDEGQIICQGTFEIEEGDEVADLQRKVAEVESKIFIQAIKQISEA